MNDKKNPSFTISILPIIVLGVALGVGFGIYRFSVEVLLLLAALFAGLLAKYYGTSWQEMCNAISEKISKAFMAISIFIFVGMIIGTWMLCGTIPMVIYYGLKLLQPSLFLVSAFIICCIGSLCTGTSFGCMGTLGLALMGVAAGLGVNPAAAAGAIVSGAYFGDKISPMSDTPNLASVVSGCQLFEHTAHSMYTTIPACILCVIVYFFAGKLLHTTGAADISMANEMLEGFAQTFHFNILLLLPMAIVLVGSALGKPTIPIMFLSIIAAGVLAVVFQKNSVGDCITAAYGGYKVTMSHADATLIPSSVKTLIERGGMTSMMSTVLKVLCSFAFAGIMTAGGFMDVILGKLKSLIRSDGTLILITVFSTIVVAIVAGNAYIPILLSGELFRDAFQKRGLMMKNLSSTLGDAGTVVIPLIPWSAGGAYTTSVLGVATLDYFPWAILCYSGFIFAIIFGFLGFGLKREKTTK